MRQRTFNINLLVFLMAALGAAPSEAARHVQAIPSGDVTACVPDDTTKGTYYRIALDIPSAVSSGRLFGAFLELYADVALAQDGEDVTRPIPLEVYALSSPAPDTLAASDLRTDTPTRCLVATAEGMRVRVDISEIVRYLIANPSENHGLAVGSLTGNRTGSLAVRSGVLPGNAVARVTYLYQRR